MLAVRCWGVSGVFGGLVRSHSEELHNGHVADIGGEVFGGITAPVFAGVAAGALVDHGAALRQELFGANLTLPIAPHHVIELGAAPVTSAASVVGDVTRDFSRNRVLVRETHCLVPFPFPTDLYPTP